MAGRVKTWGLAVAVLLATPMAAMAQEDAPLDCANAQTQADMTSCAGQDFKKADKELNAVYKKAMASQVALDKQSADISPNYVGAVKALKKAQRAWIDYRDGHCEGVSYEAAGGTMQPMLELGCKAGLTNKRVKELRELTQGMGN
jgi:uncharacterized protein YecT (DUF1311 family)